MEVMEEREKTMWISGLPTAELRARGLQRSKPPAESLLRLSEWCKDGESLQNNVDVSKEVLCYRIIDMFAQVNNKGVEDITREKLVVPEMVKLVRYEAFGILAPVKFRVV